MSPANEPFQVPDDPDIVFKSRPKVIDDRLTPQKPLKPMPKFEHPVQEPARTEFNESLINDPFQTKSKLEHSRLNLFAADTTMDEESWISPSPTRQLQNQPPLGQNGVVKDLSEFSVPPPSTEPAQSRGNSAKNTPKNSRQSAFILDEYNQATPKAHLDFQSISGAYPYSAVKRILSTPNSDVLSPLRNIGRSNGMMRKLGSVSNFVPVGEDDPNAELTKLKHEFEKMQVQAKDMKRYFKSIIRLELTRMNFAATRIQAVFRGYMVRRVPVVANMRQRCRTPKKLDNDLVSQLVARIDRLQHELDIERGHRRKMEERVLSLTNAVI